MIKTRRIAPRLLVLALAGLVGVTACGDEDDTPTTPGPLTQDEEFVSSQGGTANLGGGAQQGGVTVNVPQGAAPQGVTVTAQRVESSPEVSDANRLGAIFELGPDGTQFATPVEVQIPFPDGFSGDPLDLLMFTTDAQGRPEILTEIRVVQGEFVAGKTTHFSPFWVSAAGRVATSLELTPATLTVASGASATIQPVARNAAGRRIASPAVQYSSSDTDVATVNNQGQVTGGKVGTATITGTAGQATATMTVEVVPGRVTAVTVSPDSASVEISGTQAYVARGTDAGGNDLGVLQSVTWSSSAGSIASVSGSGVATGLAPGMATITATSFGVSGSAKIVVTPGDVTLPPGVDSVLAVTPDSLTLRSGGTSALTASVVRSDGTAGPATGVTWTTRNATVATVSNSGVVSAAQAGSTWVVGSTGYGSDSVRVAVLAGSPTSVTVSPDSLELPSGAEESLSAVARDAAGNVVNTVLSWSSADPTVATVNQQGVVRGVEIGVTTVTVSAAGGGSATAKIVVASGEPVSFGFTPDPVSVRAGQTAGVQIDPLDDRGRVTILPDTLTLDVQIRDTSVAKISGTSGVQGFKTGSTWLVATAGSVKDSVMINTVPGVAATTQFISPSGDTTVTAGDTIQVTMQGTDILGNVFTQTGFALTSANGSVVAPLGSLRFQGRTVGSTSLTAKVDTVSKSINVTVQVGPAKTLTITNPSKDTTLTSGAAITLASTVTDAFGNPRGDAVTYASSAGTVVGITGNTATAALVGTATVTATSGALNATRSISVVHGPAASVAFTTPAGDSVAIGQLDSLQTAAQGTDAAGNTFSDGIAFASSNQAVATVSSSGLVFGAGLGFANIVASRDGQADTLVVEVKQGALSVVTVTPATATASAINQTVQFNGTATDKAGNAVPTPTWAWTSTAPAVANVTAGGTTATATITALGNGTAQIIGSATKDGRTVADTATITVQVVASTVTITPDTATLEAVGDTVGLSGRVTAQDANGNTINNPTVTWSSLNTGVATVSSAGVVTAQSGGTAGIVAMVDGAADTATVTVDIKAARLVISPVADTVPVGGSVQYAATAFDANGNQITANVSWSSTAAGVATVNGSGLATGQAAGTARIIATSGTAADTAQIGVAGATSLVSTAFPGGSDLATVSAGGQVTVAVTLDMGRVSANGDLGSLQFELLYDSNVLEVANTTVGLNGGTPDTNTATAGKVSFGYISLAAQGSSDLTLLTVTFNVKAGAATGRSKLTLNYTAAPTNTSFANYATPVAVAGEIQVN